MGGRDATPSVVAPRTGAWIETGRGFYKLRPCYVAPRTGAWIETRDVGHTLGALASPLVQGRGLKQVVPVGDYVHYEVAPRTGAWIETYINGILIQPCRVAPRTGAWIETLLQAVGHGFDVVAPRTGAWIETQSVKGAQGRGAVAPRTGAWIETKQLYVDIQRVGSRPSYRGVD